MIGNRDKRILKVFGNNLKTVRTKKAISIRKLAAAADMDSSTIHRIEKGLSNPTLTTIGALARALDMHPCELLAPRS